MTVCRHLSRLMVVDMRRRATVAWAIYMSFSHVVLRLCGRTENLFKDNPHYPERQRHAKISCYMYLYGDVYTDRQRHHRTPSTSRDGSV